MRAETSATSAVAALSVAVAAFGHTLVAGDPMPRSSLAPLAALAGACWLLGSYLAGRPRLSVAVLAAVQLVVHFSLGAAAHHGTSPTNPLATPQPMGHSHHHVHGAAPVNVASPPTAVPTEQSGLADALTMTVAHLAVLFLAVSALARMHHWVARIRRILGRLVPELPAGLVPVPTLGRLLAGVPGRQPVVQRWLPSNVSRRGPPATAAVRA